MGRIPVLSTPIFQSRRDCIIQPRVASAGELPWVRGFGWATLKGLYRVEVTLSGLLQIVNGGRGWAGANPGLMDSIPSGWERASVEAIITEMRPIVVDANDAKGEAADSVQQNANLR